MSTLVFQAALGGQINMVGADTASTFTVTVPAFTGTLASLATVVNNGVAYVNSSGQPTSGSTLTFDGTTFTSGAHTLSTGNLNFSSTAQRITGDFSNATVVSRVAFKTSTVNGNTIINALPNGTAAISRFRAFNAEDPTNASYADFGVSASATIIQSSFGGTGTYLPMSFFTGGTERVSIDTSGNILVGNTAGLDAHLEVYGAGTTSTSYTNGDATGPTLYLRDSGTSANNGGQILFGAGQGIFAGIKGLITNGTGPAGDLIFQTRTTTGNVTEKMRINDLGNVGIGTASPSASAILDAQSTTKGVRMPNMTTTQKNAISSPAAGLMVFDTTLAKLCVYSGSAWQTVTSV